MSRLSRLQAVGFTLAVFTALSARAVQASWPDDPAVNLPVCTDPAAQLGTAMVSDGANGAIVTWSDGRNGSIFAQHLLASGVADPAWAVNGQPVSTGPAEQQHPAIISDGAGGALITWEDGAGSTSWDIYAQHLLANGTVDPAWPARGRALCTAPNYQLMPVIASDGAGGAFVAWRDLRDGYIRFMYQVYAQHVLASGAVDPRWPADGIPVSTPYGELRKLTIVPSDSGGAIVSWGDLRGYVFAQRVLDDGTCDPRWPVNGRALCTVSGGETPAAIPDGAGGALIAFHDWRNGSDADIYAQHILVSGVTDPAWSADAVPLCLMPYVQAYPCIVGDGAGGALVAWQDERNGVDKDIYAQHVRADGTVDPVWPANGRGLCVLPQDQLQTAIVSDRRHGAIVSWLDYRNGSNFDVYAQHVLADGLADPVWPLNGQAISTPPSFKEVASMVPAGAGGAILAWDETRNGNYDVFAQNVNADGTLGGDTRLDVGSGAPPVAVWLGRATPNPMRDGAALRFGLPRDAQVSLDILDCQGRRVSTLERGVLPAGYHAARWDGRDGAGRPAASGLYFIRLQVNGRALTGRLAVLR